MVSFFFTVPWKLPLIPRTIPFSFLSDVPAYFLHRCISVDLAREGTNAQDAAHIAYSSVSVLRQQMKPDHRVHGVLQGVNWVANSKNALSSAYKITRD